MTFSTTRAERLLAGAVLGILLFFMGSIVWVYAAGKVAGGRPGAAGAARTRVAIDWQALYPFPEGRREAPARPEPSAWERLWAPIERVHAYLLKWAKFYNTDKLTGYTHLVTAAKGYEKLVAWNFAAMSEYNGVIELPDGHLTNYVEKRDVSGAARATIELARFCEDRGIHFLYVNAPRKNCQFEDADISGVLDFSNQNADEFLKLLAEAGVDYYDLRRTLHEEGLSHHGMFFRTDLHWLPETGLWAARHILRLLHDKYSYPVDTSVLDVDKFTSVIYPSWFLGAQGRKVTLTRTEPDDFTLLYPKYPTLLHYQKPEWGIDLTGDFSILYDMRQIEGIGYYTLSTYHSYSVDGKVLIENQMVDNDVKVFIIQDSFGQTFSPFLAMGVRELDVAGWGFEGSFRSYIEATQPDIVIVLFALHEIGLVNEGDAVKSPFDFR